jgi:hypothetical protein
MTAERAPILARLDGLPRAREVRPGTWIACCPAHPDVHPSLGWSVGSDGRVLVRCHAGCAAESIVEALGAAMSDLFVSAQQGIVRVAPSVHGTRARSAGIGMAGDDPGTVGLTLADLAVAKHLPAEFLQSLGCGNDRGSSVRIPYHNADGSLAAVRTRLAMTGDRFRWRKGIARSHMACGASQRPEPPAGCSWSKVRRTAGPSGIGESPHSVSPARAPGVRNGRVS